MIKNYFKIAFRNLWKHKSFSIINVAGLAIGMAACLLIMQYVGFKLSFDQFNKNVNNIYRVVNDRYQNGELIQHGTITYSGVGRALNDDYDEVIKNTRVVPSGERIITYNDKKLAEPDVLFVENSFFSMFTYPLLAGDVNSVFKEPYAVIISEKLARKIFDYKGNDLSRFVGTMLTIQTDSAPYKIQGILKDVPANSHLQFNMLISYPTLISSGWDAANYNFTESDFWHYVQLKDGADYTSLNAKLYAFSKKHFQGNKVSGSVLIAAFIAFPVAWYAMHKWLQDFAYRIDIGWMVFVFAGIVALLIALLTVSIQAMKAAVANPIKSLRTE
jgi:putative ABC transport system permease protein